MAQPVIHRPLSPFPTMQMNDGNIEGYRRNSCWKHIHAITGHKNPIRTQSRIQVCTVGLNLAHSLNNVRTIMTANIRTKLMCLRALGDLGLYIIAVGAMHTRNSNMQFDAPSFNQRRPDWLQNANIRPTAGDAQ